MTTTTKAFTSIHEQDLGDYQHLLTVTENACVLFSQRAEIILCCVNEDNSRFYWKWDFLNWRTTEREEYPERFLELYVKDVESILSKLEALDEALDWDDNQNLFVEYCREMGHPIGLRSLSDNRRQGDSVTRLAPQAVVRNLEEFQFTGVFDIEPKPPVYYLYAKRK